MRPQELNLLMIFDAIMTENSITRAADRLALTQPAVSNALARMRQIWRDELFVKDGRGIQPTVYAQNLWTQIREPLQQLDHAVSPTSFVASEASRTFNISAPDAIVDMIWPAIRKIIEQTAPGINIHAIPYTITNAEQLLVDAEVDLVIGPPTPSNHLFRSEYLYTSCYVCVMRPDHPLAQQDLCLNKFAEAEHLLVSLSGDITGYTDQVLSQHGLSRRIAMTVNHFSIVPDLLQGSDLISVLPSTTVEQALFNGDIIAITPPLEIVPPHTSMLWHVRQENDQGLIWLREHVGQIIRAYTSEHKVRLDREFCRESNL